MVEFNGVGFCNVYGIIIAVSLLPSGPSSKFGVGTHEIHYISTDIFSTKYAYELLRGRIFFSPLVRDVIPIS